MIFDHVLDEDHGRGRGVLTSCLTGRRMYYASAKSRADAEAYLRVEHIGYTADMRKHWGGLDDPTPHDVFEFYCGGELFPVWERRPNATAEKILQHLANIGFLRPTP